jgi:photosystem II stability/assembly factor-like uncharacterized protein
MSASFPSTSAGWATALRNGHLVVYRSVNGGRSWTALRGPAARERGNCFSPQIQTVSSARAWLAIPGDGGTAIYATTDSGRSWRRIDHAASRGA